MLSQLPSAVPDVVARLPYFRRLSWFLQLFNFDVSSFFTASCGATSGYYRELLYAVVGPLALVVACAGGAVCARPRGPARARLAGAAWLLLYLTAPHCATVCARGIACETNLLGDGVRRLKADPSVDCDDLSYRAVRRSGARRRRRSRAPIL